MCETNISRLPTQINKQLHDVLHESTCNTVVEQKQKSANMFPLLHTLRAEQSTRMTVTDEEFLVLCFNVLTEFWNPKKMLGKA